MLFSYSCLLIHLNIYQSVHYYFLDYIFILSQTNKNKLFDGVLNLIILVVATNITGANYMSGLIKYIIICFGHVHPKTVAKTQHGSNPDSWVFNGIITWFV